MPRQIRKPSFSSAGLEADVMRFMAITAFCLIAIMALVKKLEPVTNQLADSTQPAEKSRVVKNQPSSTSLADRNESPPDSKTSPPSLLVPSQSIMVPDLTPAVESVESASVKVNNQANSSSEPPQSGKPVRESSPDKIAAQVSANTTTQQLLSFAFESDRAFLHLIASGKMTLYVHEAGQYLILGNDFSLTPAQPVGRLYEVQAHSIPAQVSRILERESHSYQYLVVLPPASERQLQQFLGQPGVLDRGGALVINKQGRLRYEN